jgi:hypothetical protein
MSSSKAASTNSSSKGKAAPVGGERRKKKFTYEVDEDGERCKIVNENCGTCPCHTAECKCGCLIDGNPQYPACKCKACKSCHCDCIAGDSISAEHGGEVEDEEPVVIAAPARKKKAKKIEIDDEDEAQEVPPGEEEEDGEPEAEPADSHAVDDDDDRTVDADEEAEVRRIEKDELEKSAAFIAGNDDKPVKENKKNLTKFRAKQREVDEAKEMLGALGGLTKTLTAVVSGDKNAGYADDTDDDEEEEEEEDEDDGEAAAEELYQSVADMGKRQSPRPQQQQILKDKLKLKEENSRSASSVDDSGGDDYMAALQRAGRTLITDESDAARASSDTGVYDSLANPAAGTKANSGVVPVVSANSKTISSMFKSAAASAAAVKTKADEKTKKAPTPVAVEEKKKKAAVSVEEKKKTPTPTPPAASDDAKTAKKKKELGTESSVWRSGDTFKLAMSFPRRNGKGQERRTVEMKLGYVSQCSTSSTPGERPFGMGGSKPRQVDKLLYSMVSTAIASSVSDWEADRETLGGDASRVAMVLVPPNKSSGNLQLLPVIVDNKIWKAIKANSVTKGEISFRGSTPDKNLNKCATEFHNFYQESANAQLVLHPTEYNKLLKKREREQQQQKESGKIVDEDDVATESDAEDDDEDDEGDEQEQEQEQKTPVVAKKSMAAKVPAAKPVAKPATKPAAKPDAEDDMDVQDEKPATTKRKKETTPVKAPRPQAQSAAKDKNKMEITENSPVKPSEPKKAKSTPAVSAPGTVDVELSGMAASQKDVRVVAAFDALKTLTDRIDSIEKLLVSGGVIDTKLESSAVTLRSLLESGFASMRDHISAAVAVQPKPVEAPKEKPKEPSAAMDVADSKEIFGVDSDEIAEIAAPMHSAAKETKKAKDDEKKNTVDMELKYEGGDDPDNEQEKENVRSLSLTADLNRSPSAVSCAPPMQRKLGFNTPASFVPPTLVGGRPTSVQFAPSPIPSAQAKAAMGQFPSSGPVSAMPPSKAGAPPPPPAPSGPMTPRVSGFNGVGLSRQPSMGGVGRAPIPSVPMGSASRGMFGSSKGPTGFGKPPMAPPSNSFNRPF